MPRSLIVLLLLLLLPQATIAEIKGFARLSWTYSDTDEPWLRSFLRNGTGVTRYDHFNDGLDLSQIAIDGQWDLSDALSLNLTALYYPDGERRLGFTEAFLDWRPIGDGWSQRVRLGAFYPEMSAENPDIAWNSPYTYSFSAINSWIAEELRIIGAEWRLSRNGRRFQSRHSWDIVAAAYWNNDPFGTMLSWRGWGLHNRQTFLGERVEFADYPSLAIFENPQPSWVEPFHEIDDRPGFYLGGHWRYGTRSDLRVYYFDNQGNPVLLDDNGQYSWRSRFLSVAWQYRFNRDTRVLVQWMDGDTLMGYNAVHVDYNAAYAMLSHKMGDHRFSIRYDDFDVVEDDHYPQDPNASRGDGWTLAWRTAINKHYHVGVEWLRVNSWNDNRWLWEWPREEAQQQWTLVLERRF